jgi:hypothetical protein
MQAKKVFMDRKSFMYTLPHYISKQVPLFVLSGDKGLQPPFTVQYKPAPVTSSGPAGSLPDGLSTRE